MGQSSIYSGVDEFRLVDVDGVFLTNPNDFIVIREPDGFDELQIVLERDGRGGFDFEYGEAETMLGFDGFESSSLATALPENTGRYLTEEIFTQVGSDMNVKLQYFANGNTTTPIYEGFLIGSSRDHRDYITFYNVERLDFGARLKTRLNKVIDLESSTDLDGNPISPLAMREIPLHSQVVRKVFTGFARDTQPASIFGVGYNNSEINAGGVDVQWVMDMSDNPVRSLTESFDYGNVVFGPSTPITITPNPSAGTGSILDSTVLNDNFFHINFNEQSATIRVTARALFTAQAFYTAATIQDTYTDLRFTFTHRIAVENSLGNLKGSINNGATGAFVIPSSPPFSNQTNLDLNTDITLTDIENGDRIYLWIDVEPSISGLVVGGGDPDLVSLNVGFNGLVGNTSFNRFEADTFERPSIVEATYFNETLDKALEMATGESGLLESTVFQNRIIDNQSAGCGGLNINTTGFKIRDRDQPLRVTINDLLSLAKSRYGCDFAIYYDNLGNASFLLEKDTHFFQNKKILTLSNIHNPVITRVNTEILANEYRVGFSEFAKPNESGTSEGISTQSDYLSTIQKDDKTLNFISDIIGDGTEIERVRRNGIQNADDESDEKDDNVFVIKINEFGDTSFYSPALYGSGDFFNIQRDATNNRIIINGLIINDVQQNDYINISGQTNRQIDGVPILDLVNNRTILPCSTETQNDTIFNDFNFRQSDNSTIRYTYNPERLESFSNVTGLIDSRTNYNIDHANSQFLFNNFQYFAGSLSKKPGTDEIRFLTKKAITTLQKQYDSATCGLTTDLINERANHTLQFLRGIRPAIFDQNVYEFTAQLTFTDLIRIKEAVRNESTEDINYGFIEFSDNDGTLRQGFPIKVTYNPVTLVADFLLWGKA